MNIAFIKPIASLMSFNRFRVAPKACYTKRLVSRYMSSSSETPIKQPRKFVPFPFKYQEEVEIEIADITNLGNGVGRYKIGDGDQEWVIMVPRVLPGEKVIVKIYKNHDSYSEADLVKVLSPSPDRVSAPCPYFEQCGGCQYQHMNIAAQRLWKQNQVKNLLSRIGEIEDVSMVNPVVGTDHLFGYRSKITPHYDRPRKSDPELDIGFQQLGTHKIIDIDQCIIASPAINEKYALKRKELKEKIPAALAKERAKKLQGATLLFREIDNEYVCTDAKEIVHQTVCNVTFMYKAGEFFQNNRYVMPLMVEHVRHQITTHFLPIHNHNPTIPKYLVDAYCGSGLFSLCLSNLFNEVYGVEISNMAIDFAKQNALTNGITNAQFVCGSSEAIFTNIQHLPRKQSVVIIDPPRKGCDMIFLNQLFDFQPSMIIYVSCDPATQARDSKEIIANGYKIVDITPFDLFPQTRHIENVITFQLPQHL